MITIYGAVCMVFGFIAMDFYHDRIKPQQQEEEKEEVVEVTTNTDNVVPFRRNLK
ncbi:hypothetical protein [Gracilibacillus sp. YIM 98692]|uniref:hypothetical protein n=1 Tax=Gracilibacillus sp. YIM 98692 TaxID=2663532 RepID=UPI0013D3F46F|nr:hypothetical protein [Gracilibacillus sp. YIM 98692]